MSSQLLIGRPGHVLSSEECPDAYSTRIGGQPIYFKEAGKPLPSMTRCDVCSSELTLILQTYAPLDPSQCGTSLKDRFLYILGCTEYSCGSKPGSWKALRCQLFPPPPLAAEAAVADDDDKKIKTVPNPNQHSKPSSHPLPPKQQPSNDWGLGYCSTTDGDGDDTFDFSDLDAALKSAQDKPSTVPHHHHHKSNSNKASGNNNNNNKANNNQSQQQYPQPYVAKLKHSLPGFYLYADTEPTSSSSITTTQHHNHNQASNAKKDNNIDAHIQELLMRYEAEEGPLSATLSSINNSSSINDDNNIILQGDALDKAANNSSSSSNVSKQQQVVDVWSGEKYEEDAVLGAEGRRAIAAAYLAFSKRLTRIPDQCARYWFNGTPLWPTTPIHRHSNNDDDDKEEEEKEEGGVCGVCGRERVFEMQLMSPVVAAIEEVAGWLEVDGGVSLLGEEKRKKGVIPEGWEWVTIGVWTCPQSCNGGGCWVEEEVCICNE